MIHSKICRGNFCFIIKLTYGAPFGKKLFWAYLDHNLSDIYIGNIRLISRTNCTLSRTKKYAQNKLDISDLYIGQIVV